MQTLQLSFKLSSLIGKLSVFKITFWCLFQACLCRLLGFSSDPNMKVQLTFFLMVIRKIPLLIISNNYNCSASLATVIAFISDSGDH